MDKAHTFYIALGSNTGGRFQHLQKAINVIFERVGRVDRIAKVYNTPALGFEGDDFLNTCISVVSKLAPEEVMQELLSIEKELGRTRSGQSGYASRPIDLDVILIDDLVLDLESLIIPHPRMQLRQFVLQPLNDIASEVIHPVLQQSVGTLTRLCKDDSDVQPIDAVLQNPMEAYGFSSKNYIAIEGNIGAGKTSLATMISEDFNAKLILERFADNPFLPKFYQEPQRYAFALEMSFLADRYQQISDDLSQLDLFRDFIVSDYDVFKSLIFSKVTLVEDEFKLYRKLFYLMYKDIAKPELYVYLYQKIDRLQQNIRKRGRDYEQQIEDAYLEKINAGYLEFLRNQNELNVKIIDITDRDFVANRADYLWLLKEINDGI
ncbi:2-amino-4-hydroxy-6-hydroxymethyldihydropteridine diphosphokinase [Mangrovimonas sp. YM274]|uniref:2-amino-4-hydroxy-6- hydroxymethyldihydropteridine diphosphokinase n=1 Tax=Mangrovimonas sp. YM274 TaxID=3070660 RepID=UPI0027DC1BCF|nr:2-amino-4-hydroxy-6-hydroxymethyldihydropteridine diphosphokinase [Mangrovimonas sp. YM274]WMI69449.1 2-amino-4-hydroxy-6-hydroxymethyldihydropteridine diphosphokinase [Mangrovimonas sp. YM274]